MQIQELPCFSQFIGEYEIEFSLTYYFRRLMIVITYTILHSVWMHGNNLFWMIFIMKMLTHYTFVDSPTNIKFSADSDSFIAYFLLKLQIKLHLY